MNDFRQIKLEGKLLQMEEFNWAARGLYKLYPEKRQGE